MKIRAAVLYEQGKPQPFAESRPLVVEEVELAPPGPGEVLVEIRAAGLCHSDLSAIAGARIKETPLVPGHEAAGIVREIGEGVSRVAPDDHVVLVFVASCGACAACLRGEPHLCDVSWQARSSGALITGARRLSLDGRPLNHNAGVSAFAEFAVVAEASVVAIDREVAFEDAAIFGCAVVTGVGAVVNTARVPPGATIAVVGLGGVGLNAVLGGVLTGAGRIFALDVNETKLELARRLGATDVIDASDPECVEHVREATRGGVDFAFETAGSIAAMETAYGLCRRGGTTVCAGLPRPESKFSYFQSGLVGDERRIVGSYMGSCVPRRDIPRFLRLFRQGKLPVNRLRSGFVDLDGLNTAFDRLAAGDAVRQILRFD